MSPISPQYLWIWVLFFIQSVFNVKFQNSENRLGRSKLILFQGKERYELQGKDCPVGITFVKPQRFSCACVVGVWAFYDEWCAPPVKVIGGFNHCFQMPPYWIQQVTIWSNPMRVLDSTLTVFDGDEEYTKLKVYRNTHITISNVSSVVSHNSSWTLINQNTGLKICLKGWTEMDQSESALTPVYCHFSHVDSYIQEINTFIPNCDEKMKQVEPDRCDYYEDTNDESLCTSLETLEAYEKLKLKKDTGLREFRKRSRMTTTTTLLPTNMTDLLTHEFSLPWPIGIENPLNDTILKTNGLRSAEEVFKRGKKSPKIASHHHQQQQQQLTNQMKTKSKSQIFVDFPSNPEAKPENQNKQRSNRGQNQIFIDFPQDQDEDKPEPQPQPQPQPEAEPEPEAEAEAESEGTTNKIDFTEELKLIVEHEDSFLILNKSNSNPFILAQLWAYHKQTILTMLNLKREDDIEIRVANQIYQLLNVSKNIMQKTCGELIRPEFFNMAMETFLNVQRKNLHWKPPFIANEEFQRILHSLQTCLKRAQVFQFTSRNGCLIKEPKYVYLKNEKKILVIPTGFKSNGFEPIVESIWKVIINAHSYCYEDFSQFYNDHHRYTTLFTPIFTNGIYKIWFQNKTLPIEYNGVAGNIERLLREIDRCTVASRYVSAYPWDLTRPDIGNQVYNSQFKRRKRDLQTTKLHTQLPKPVLDSSDFDPSDLDPSRLDIINRNENLEWKNNRRILKGLGFCLKKFNEMKTKLGQNCD